MLNRKMKPIAVAVGAAFAVSVAGNVAADGVDPFEASLLEDGVLIATDHKEGGCGEDKKSEDGDEAKCGEGKCGEDGDSEEGDSEEGEDEGEGESEEAEEAEEAEEE